MADEFLSALAGLSTGFVEGLDKKRAFKEREQERSFRLQQFESQQRRNAMLDALNEEVARGQLAVQQAQQGLAQEAAERERANQELVDYPTAGGKNIQISRGAYERLQEMQAQLDMMNQGKVQVDFGGGMAGFLDPKDAANYFSKTSQERDRRGMQIKRLVADRAEALLQQNPGMDPDLANQEAIRQIATFFPDELGDVVDALPKPAPPPVPLSEGERPAGLLDRLLLGVSGIGNPEFRGVASASDPIEALREQMYGPAPPQTLEELQAAREGRLLEFRGRSNTGTSRISRLLEMLGTDALPAAEPQGGYYPLTAGR